MNTTAFLTQVYERFNARDMDAVLASMHEDVTWANGLDGGYVYGREGVRDYWTRQWAMVDPHVVPIGFSVGANGEAVLRVHQVVHDLSGSLLLDREVCHIFFMEDGLIRRFEIG